MLKKRWLTLAMAAMVTGALTACAGDEGGGGGTTNDTGTYENRSDDDTGRMDGTMDTRDDERGGAGGATTNDPVNSGREP